MTSFGEILSDSHSKCLLGETVDTTERIRKKRLVIEAVVFITIKA